ncbi:MAG: hypothetical protein VX542_01230, partial [Cyanobacteriota bacterium]|nr:hypothetical protein [Cyanobacteriota bacterium]
RMHVRAVIRERSEHRNRCKDAECGCEADTPRARQVMLDHPGLDPVPFHAPLTDPALPPLTCRAVHAIWGACNRTAQKRKKLTPSSVTQTCGPSQQPQPH